MIEPVTNETEITPEWLTGRLLENGHLPRGRVSKLGISSFETFFSTIYRLEVSYSTGRSAALPSKLLLKIPFPCNEASLKMGEDEVRAYTLLARMMNDPPIVRCFDAVYSTDTRASCLLLEDMSEMHYQPALPLPPSKRHCELCVEALARLHAFWWEHPDLDGTIGQLHDETSLKEIITRIENDISGFIAFMGDRLSPPRLTAYEKALAFVPAFWQRRLTSIRHSTLIHGDAHTFNMLHPKDPQTGRTLLIDLATCNRIRPPTNDLAYMMALQWYPERRAVMEDALLRHYHAALLSMGVKNYSWEDCRLDYRYSVITHLFTPVGQWVSNQLPATVWWHNFERISEAYEDLGCDELL
jgi:hypothetical protein